MNEFQYEQAPDTKSATRLFSEHANAKYLGGGTNLVDLMREGIERPEMLVDVTALPNSIETREDGSLLIGAALIARERANIQNNPTPRSSIRTARCAPRWFQVTSAGCERSTASSASNSWTSRKGFPDRGTRFNRSKSRAA